MVTSESEAGKGPPSMPTEYHRYAVYAAPGPDTALGRFGISWLGRDPASGEPVPRPTLPGLPPERIAALGVSPARYGFHGTLKPPFTLVRSQDGDALRAAVEALAATLTPVRFDGFAVRALARFVALLPDPQPPALAALAARCVADLDRFRAPPHAEELEKRRATELSDRQEAMLQRWGYPYVMEEFRFHLTLTDALDPQDRDAVTAALVDGLSADGADAEVLGPWTLDHLALFAEPHPGAPFRLIARLPLSARPARP